MDMERVKALMKEVGSGFLATTDGDRAAVRPMGGWAWVESELWCATGLDSAKVADIRKRPHIEYCFMDPQGRHVRIAGRCSVSSELSDRKQLLDLVPGIAQHIQGAEDPNYAVLRLSVGSVRYWPGPDGNYVEVPLG